MATILVVDDSAVDRKLAGSIAERIAGARAVYAANGMEALAAIPHERPDLVLTDMQMGEMDGLQLVTEVRSRYPNVPVILMTAHGSEEIAVKALQRGAASYVPKRNLATDLVQTIEGVLAIARTHRQQSRILECWMQSESQFMLDNDLTLIPALINHLQENLARIRLCDETGLIRVSVALHEALVNAVVHGNLEIASDQREVDDESPYHRQIEERRQLEPYRDRRVHVIAEESRSEVVYVIQDDGPGFNPEALPDPTDPMNLDKVGGRGLLLIRTFMDEVFHNETGNQVTMVKRRDSHR